MSLRIFDEEADGLCTRVDGRMGYRTVQASTLLPNRGERKAHRRIGMVISLGAILFNVTTRSKRSSISNKSVSSLFSLCFETLATKAATARRHCSLSTFNSSSEGGGSLERGASLAGRRRGGLPACCGDFAALFVMFAVVVVGRREGGKKCTGSRGGSVSHRCNDTVCVQMYKRACCSHFTTA